MCLFADVITDVRQTEDIIPVITAAEHLADMWTEQQQMIDTDELSDLIELNEWSSTAALN